jgi:hypothetical protein
LADRYKLEPRGLINLRGIGKVETSFLTGRKVNAEPELHRQRVGSRATLAPR